MRICCNRNEIVVNEAIPERSRPFPTNSQTHNELLLIKEPRIGDNQLSTLHSKLKTQKRINYEKTGKLIRKYNCHFY